MGQRVMPSGYQRQGYSARATNSEILGGLVGWKDQSHTERFVPL
jgi:hypothetical protein